MFSSQFMKIIILLRTYFFQSEYLVYLQLLVAEV